MENMISVLLSDKQKKIAWLAAMLECEGTFTFAYNEQEKDGRIHSHIQPKVLFVNSDFAMVDAVDAVMTSLGFEPYRKPNPTVGGIGKKPKREIGYFGFKCLPLLIMLRDEMVGDKVECVDAMIAFIEFRKKLQAQGKSKQKYSDVEFSILRKVREINSGHWKQIPKFSKISMDAVEERRAALKIVK